MSRAQAKPTAVPPAAPPRQTPLTPLPKWLTETPSIYYELETWTEGDSKTQNIYLTREEYVYLKCVLAERRGMEVPEKVWERVEQVADIDPNKW